MFRNKFLSMVLTGSIFISNSLMGNFLIRSARADDKDTWVFPKSKLLNTPLKDIYVEWPVFFVKPRTTLRQFLQAGGIKDVYSLDRN